MGLRPTAIGRAKSNSTSTLLSAMAISCVVSSIWSGDWALRTRITLPPVIRLACLAATSSRGLPNKSAGSPLARCVESASSAVQVALGPALTSGYPCLPTNIDGGLGPTNSLTLPVSTVGSFDLTSASKGQGEIPHNPLVPLQSIHSGNIGVKSKSIALSHTAHRTRDGGIQRDDYAATSEKDG